MYYWQGKNTAYTKQWETKATTIDELINTIMNDDNIPISSTDLEEEILIHFYNSYKSIPALLATKLNKDKDEITDEEFYDFSDELWDKFRSASDKEKVEVLSRCDGMAYYQNVWSNNDES
ncbi:hypothetical protein SY212_02700 [Ligilactobacillus agilis]|uniref:Uncharacterized protein n=1 Tax=Ligilactobacillus agilis TaxID=1601 RepID=A0A6F9XJA3_9LACO|nr:hypothetical protein [Ligilactobacillus agilis]GET05240.1 hypothetical protein SY212_02700 [Ligilactobacillus agilis]